MGLERVYAAAKKWNQVFDSKPSTPTTKALCDGL